MSRRRGRPRKTTAKRHPDGTVHRRSQAQIEQDTVSVAIQARQRVFGVSESDAKAMQETSFLAQLRVQDEISQRQYDAAMTYQALIEDYYHLYPIRKLAAAGDLDRGGGFDASDGTDPDYIERARKITGMVSQCREALNDANKVDGRTRAVIENVVIRRTRQPWLVEPLRLGLNVLANVFNLPLPKPLLDKSSEGRLHKTTIPQMTVNDSG